MAAPGYRHTNSIVIYIYIISKNIVLIYILSTFLFGIRMGSLVQNNACPIDPNSPLQRATGIQSAGNPETRGAIHSGAPLIILPLVGRRAGGLKRLGC